MANINYANITGDVGQKTVDQLVAPTLVQADTDLKNFISQFPADPSQADMIKLQKAFQSWTLLISTVSTCYKEISDAFKGIIQKI